MISSTFLWKIYKAGDVSQQLNVLYDKKINGKNSCIMIDYGEVTIDFAIKFQEKRLKDLLVEIQKGFKTHLNI